MPGAADRRAHLSIRLLTGTGRWETLGADTAPGVWAEDVQLTADQAGPLSASWSLRRTGRRAWPDLAAASRAEVEVAGMTVWGGRVRSTPTEEATVSVDARGHQAALDDDLYDLWFVRRGAGGAYPSHSDTVNFTVGNLTPNGTVDTSDNGILVSIPNGATYPAFGVIGATIDLGEGRGFRRATAKVETSANAGTVAIVLRGSSSPNATIAADDLYNSDLTTAGAGPTWRAGTTAAARRYLHVFMLMPGAAGTTGAIHWARVTELTLYESTSYESANASTLTASTVVRAARDQVPGLDPTDDLIDGAAFTIPDLAPDGWSTARDVMAAGNAYQGWVLGVDARRRVFFRPRPQTPVLEAGAWPGAELTGLSPVSMDDIYNRVVVEGTGPAGPVRTVRTRAAPFLDRQGVSRAAKLQVGATITPGIASQIGDVWLSERSRTPFKGTLTVTGVGGVRLIAGSVSLHPAALLLYVGQRIRFLHLIDPDTGGLGRAGLITSVSYMHATETAVVSIDNDYERLETLLTRFAALSAPTT